MHYISHMENYLPKDWKNKLIKETESNYFKELSDFVISEYKQKECYPPLNQIFNAFEHCNLAHTKVVIIGQDPYHQPGYANGLCFSVNSGIPVPASLKNIFTEISTNFNCLPPIDGNLEFWAAQGVLLLNATLSVEKGKAGSHQRKGWEKFTDAVIKLVSNENENVVFMLWGGFAHKKEKLIDTQKHLVLKSGHPSPLSANRGFWFGNEHFKKCNFYLKNHHKKEIEWFNVN